MTQRVTLRQWNGLGQMPPGTWVQWEGWPRPTVCCPICGVRSLLDEGHTVADDGTVTPSLLCECGGWHAFVRLVE